MRINKPVKRKILMNFLVSSPVVVFPPMCVAHSPPFSQSVSKLWSSLLPKTWMPSLLCCVALLYCFQPNPFLFLFSQSRASFLSSRLIDFYFIIFGQLALRPTFSFSSIVQHTHTRAHTHTHKKKKARITPFHSHTFLAKKFILPLSRSAPRQPQNLKTPKSFFHPIRKPKISFSSFFPKVMSFIPKT